MNAGICGDRNSKTRKISPQRTLFAGVVVVLRLAVVARAVAFSCFVWGCEKFNDEHILINILV